MTDYRRNFITGGSFFFTANLGDRRLRLLTEHIDQLRVAFRETRQRHPFTTEAMVVLPDHLHASLDAARGRRRFHDALAADQVGFSRALPTSEPISGSRAAKGERGIWQRRFWEHTIWDENDFARHIDYIHINPVKHRLVTRVRDWPYSSFHRMVKLRIYPEDWAGDVSGANRRFWGAALMPAM